MLSMQGIFTINIQDKLTTAAKKKWDRIVTLAGAYTLHKLHVLLTSDN